MNTIPRGPLWAWICAHNLFYRPRFWVLTRNPTEALAVVPSTHCWDAVSVRGGNSSPQAGLPKQFLCFGRINGSLDIDDKNVELSRRTVSQNNLSSRINIRKTTAEDPLIPDPTVYGYER